MMWTFIERLIFGAAMWAEERSRRRAKSEAILREEFDAAEERERANEARRPLPDDSGWN